MILLYVCCFFTIYGRLKEFASEYCWKYTGKCNVKVVWKDW